MQGWLQLTGKSICTASKHCAIRNYVISKKKKLRVRTYIDLPKRSMFRVVQVPKTNNQPCYDVDIDDNQSPWPVALSE